jgi:hypothetical protein
MHASGYSHMSAHGIVAVTTIGSRPSLAASTSGAWLADELERLFGVTYKRVAL